MTNHAPERRETDLERFPPEIRLLLLLARLELESEHIGKIDALTASAIDWIRFEQACVYHRLAGMVHKHLAAGNVPAAPIDVIERLAAVRQRNSIRSLHLAAELKTILTLFQCAKLPALPYKGPVFAERIYGNLSLRPMVDLDIVIPKTELERVDNLLAPLGYQVSQTLSSAGIRYMTRTKHHLAWRDPARNMLVEIHWGFAPSVYGFNPNIAKLFEEAKQTSWQGLEIPLLPVARQLVLLAVHGAGHCWAAIEWLAMVAELIRQNPTLDWADTRQFARRHNVERRLDLALKLSSDLLGAPVPQVELERLADDLEVARLTAVVPHLMANTSGRGSYVREITFQMALTAYPLRKFRILIAGVFEHMVFPIIYPARNIGLLRNLVHTFARPFSFVWRCLLTGRKNGRP